MSFIVVAYDHGGGLAFVKRYGLALATAFRAPAAVLAAAPFHSPFTEVAAGPEM